MKSPKLVRTFALLTLISLYLVVFAGSIVRATGSGMGCPDWPQCFGYLIPPTSEDQISWKAEKSFEAGQLIIHEEKLWEATSDFTTSQTFEPKHWEIYTKHDYAKFNAAHTWTEYINRLCSAVLGVFCLLLLIFVYTKKQALPIKTLAWLILLGTLFQAWLGAKVVDSVLNPVKISIHLYMALLLIAWSIALVDRAYGQAKLSSPKLPRHLKNLILIFFIIGLIQLVLGTQIRQEIDQIAIGFSDQQRGLWVDFISYRLTIHIALAYTLLILCALVWRKIKTIFGEGGILIKLSLLSLILSYSVGLIFRNFDFPAWAQPVHIVLSVVLFGIQFLMIKRAYFNQSLIKF
ncbi:MAG: COX15/CtaA family protein [Flavobacteriales bacterium]